MSSLSEEPVLISSADAQSSGEEEGSSVEREEAVAVDASTAQRKPKSAALEAALQAAEEAAAITDTPLQATHQAQAVGGEDGTVEDGQEDSELDDDAAVSADGASGAVGVNGSFPMQKPAGKLDAAALELPHLPSPFDGPFPESCSSPDRWKSISPDSHCLLYELEAGDVDSPNAAILTRVYINVECRLGDGTLCLDYPHEELDFTLGQATVPKGLEMAVCQMRRNQRALLRCCSDYGFSSTRRPKEVPPSAPLFFLVRVLRWEKEKNLHQMEWADKLSYCSSRREWAKTMFACSPPKLHSALRQYDKALTVLDSVRNHEVDQKTVQHKKELMTMFLANQAQCYMSLKDWSRVLEVTGKALTLDARHVKCLYRRGEAHRAREEWPEALQQYTRLLREYEAPLSASEQQRAEIDQKKQADTVLLTAVAAAVRDVKRRSEQQATQQRKRMDGFISRAASKDATASAAAAAAASSGSTAAASASPAASSPSSSSSSSSSGGGGGGLGLYDDKPLIDPSVSLELEQQRAIAEAESLSAQAAEAVQAVKWGLTRMASALANLVRRWCSSRRKEEQQEQQQKKES